MFVFTGGNCIIHPGDPDTLTQVKQPRIGLRLPVSPSGKPRKTLRLSHVPEIG
jgi:hypothetical protein